MHRPIFIAPQPLQLWQLSLLCDVTSHARSCSFSNQFGQLGFQYRTFNSCICKSSLAISHAILVFLTILLINTMATQDGKTRVGRREKKLFGRRINNPIIGNGQKSQAS
jgi:hypothetical protein